jgi:hypothetical protein
VILYWSRRWIRCRRDASIPDAQHRELDSKRERKRCGTVLRNSVVMLMSAVPCAFCTMRRRGVVYFIFTKYIKMTDSLEVISVRIVSSPSPVKGLRSIFIWIPLHFGVHSLDSTTRRLATNIIGCLRPLFNISRSTDMNTQDSTKMTGGCEGFLRMWWLRNWYGNLSEIIMGKYHVGYLGMYGGDDKMDLKEWLEGVNWIQLAQWRVQYRDVLDAGPHWFVQTGFQNTDLFSLVICVQSSK